MAIEYLGLSQINGPLVVLEGVQNASFEEIVEITVNGKEDSAVFLYGFIQSRKHGNKFYTLGISPHDDSRPIDRSGKPHCIFRQANQYEISFCGIGVLGRSNDIYIVHGIDARGIGYAQREFQPAHV